MRTLFATDGSGSADRARDLLAALPWPDGTEIRIISALEPWVDVVGAWIASDRDEDDTLAVARRQAVTILEDAERAIARPGRIVTNVLRSDLAGPAIVAEARQWGADLIVIGSRGHGPLTSALLGSVSAEVADQAPCSVLVVRDTAIESVVLADDGSEGARVAVDLVRSWTVLRGLPVDVVSAARPPLPLSALDAGWDLGTSAYADALLTSRRAGQALAEQQAEALRVEHIPAVGIYLEGEPAHEIVEFARDRPRPLIVLGTRGHRGLTAVVLGSVARRVLLHAPGSVLVARPTVGAAERSGTDHEATAGVA